MLIATWILYTIVGILVFSLAFLWAVRARQFWNQDRARYLPLEAEDTPEAADVRGGMPTVVLAMILIFVVAMGLVVLTLIASYIRG